MRNIASGTTLLTADDVWNMSEVPGKRFELVEGELIEMPGPTAYHMLVMRTIVRFLERLPKVDDIGYVFSDGLSYVLRRDPDTIRVPDASFVSFERLPASGFPDKYWPGAPNLAVEIASPSDRVAPLHAKAQEYLDAGTSVVWLFWLTTREIDIMTPDGETRRLGSDDDLVMPDVLPAARVRVSDLFPAIPTSPENPAG